MALAFYSFPRNQCLFVVFPLNLIIALAWWIQDRWARVAQAPSWIDREVERRAERERTFWARPERAKQNLTLPRG